MRGRALFGQIVISVATSLVVAFVLEHYREQRARAPLHQPPASGQATA